MKSASPGTLALLAGGKSKLSSLYDITLTSGAVYRFCDSDAALTVGLWNGSSIGTAHPYLMGWSIKRGATTQAVGLDAKEMELTIAPMSNNPGGPPLIAGFSLIQACRLGLLDNAKIQFSKLFSTPIIGTAPPDVSNGGTPWDVGVIAEMEIFRFAVKFKMSSNILVLNQVQMPRNLYQPACSHTVYDAGCAILKSAFTSTGTVSGTPTSTQFNTSLTQVDGFFALGVITFTSGANTGFSSTVKQFLHASGVVQCQLPFPAPIVAGDAFSIYPGCDLLQATCVSKFANLAHFKATPFVPVDETLYDGGSSNPPNPNQGGGGQLGNNIGSNIGGNILGQN